MLLICGPQPPSDITEHNAPAALIAEMQAAAAHWPQGGLRASERAMARLGEKARVAKPA